MRFEYVEPVYEEVTVKAEPSVIIVYYSRPCRTYTHYNVMVLEEASLSEVNYA